MRLILGIWRYVVFQWNISPITLVWVRGPAAHPHLRHQLPAPPSLHRPFFPSYPKSLRCPCLIIICIKLVEKFWWGCRERLRSRFRNLVESSADWSGRQGGVCGRAQRGTAGSKETGAVTCNTCARAGWGPDSEFPMPALARYRADMTDVGQAVQLHWDKTDVILTWSTSLVASEVVILTTLQ